MKNTYRRLIYEEMDRRKLFPGSGLCGYFANPMVKDSNGQIKIKARCCITRDRCVYWGQRLEIRDYYQCPVYLEKEKEWKRGLETS